MNKVYKDGCIVIKRKDRFFYGVYGNDALIINKYFGYKLYKRKQFGTGFPVKNLEVVLKRIADLSIDYKVVARDIVICEKHFEENCYEILDESLNHIETIENDRNLGAFFGKKKRPNKKECIGILKSLCENVDYYTGECIEGLSEESKEKILHLINFLSPKTDDEPESKDIPQTDAVELSYNEEKFSDLVENEAKQDFEEATEEKFEEELGEDEITCKNCIEYKKSECFGKQQLCEDFRYAPNMDDEKRKTWPKFGDATFLRIHGRHRY